MGKLLRAILGVLGGYVAGGAVGLGLVSVLSQNAHDKSIEAVMTAAFVAGPIGAVLGLGIALLTGRSTR